MDMTYNNMLCSVTEKYLSAINLNKIPDPATIESELLSKVKDEIDLHNAAVSTKSERWNIPRSLSFSQIADIMIALHNICRISTDNSTSDSDYDILAIYQTSGENKGIYVTAEDEFRKIARSYHYTLSSKEFDEIMIAMRDKAIRRKRCLEPNLIAVNNGIFDYDTKILHPFSPDKVFLTKSHVNYNPNARNIVIHNMTDNTDWDVESWMNELSDDPEIVQVLWEILGAIIRPNVSWNKSAWLYSEEGNNGKGTLCSLMRNLCGDGAYASIPLSAFGTDFMLEPLTHASAIIVDENDVGTFVDRAANLKAVITNDVITINRKFKTPVKYQFYGFMVQCLNEFPRIKDKSDSFYRRQLFIPMEKCFTGKERRYIKSDYLKRKDVLEYVLCKVLNTDYYELSEPQACKDILNEYKEFNDPIRQFFQEVVEQECKWDLLPFTFLYQLYRAWIITNVPQGGAVGKNKFIQEITTIANQSSTWHCDDKNRQIRTGNYISCPEPLIAKYNLTEWKSLTYHGNDIDLICTPSALNVHYRGLQRLSAIGISPVTIETTE